MPGQPEAGDDDTNDGEDVFDDVTPDPDGVLDAFGIDSPEELIDSIDDESASDDDPVGNVHEPTRDEAIDATDTVASDLFEDLERAARELEATETVVREPRPFDAADRGTQVGFDEESAVDGGSDENAVKADNGGFPPDWERAFDRAADDRCGHPSRSHSSAKRPAGSHSESLRTGDAGEEAFTLRGPRPEPVRVANDAFGSVG